MEETKICTKCLEQKDINEFNKNSRWCKNCKKDYAKKYQKENAEKIKVQKYIYKEKNLKKVKEYQKTYRQKNKESIKEYMKVYHQKYNKENKSKIKITKKIWREKNKEHIQKRQQNHYQNNVEYYKEYSKKWYKKNKVKLLQKSKDWKKNNIVRTCGLTLYLTSSTGELKNILEKWINTRKTKQELKERQQQILNLKEMKNA